jgi:hypothetical protein
LVFFGTPFRGAEGMSQVEMLAAAQREYDDDDIQLQVLKILEPGNEFLQDVVDQFGNIRKKTNQVRIACFYELKSTNVGKVVGKSDRTVGHLPLSYVCSDTAKSIRRDSLSTKVRAV